jgi:TP901 family phage tail tape measure protein
MAVEDGFIEYTIELKGAAKASKEFKELTEKVISGTKSYEDYDRFLLKLSSTMPKHASNLRESARAQEAFNKAARDGRDISGASNSGSGGRFIQYQNSAKATRDLESAQKQLKASDAALGAEMDKQNARLDKRKAELLGVKEAQKQLNAAWKEQRSAASSLSDAEGGDLSTASGKKALADASRGYANAIRQTEAAEVNLGKATAYSTKMQKSAAQQQRDYVSQLSRQRYALNDISNTLAVFGGALAGIGIYSMSAAASFQAAFANVERTLSPSDLAANKLSVSVDGIRNSLVQLSGQIPVTFEELSKIATIGNQMDIAANDIIGFTGTIARFSSVSGVSIEETSKAFGGFMAQTGLAPQYLENLASSLALVSVNSNATEAEILSVSREIASLATGAGLSADQVVGLSTTLASLRIPAERSRGSLETYFQTLKRAVAEGGRDLENFATVVGVTADELDSMVRSGKGAEVLEGFLKNLNKYDSVSITNALDELNLKQLRVTNTFTRLSQNVDDFSKNMGIATEGFISGDEAIRQYDYTLNTVNAQLTIFQSGIRGLLDAMNGEGIPVLGGFLKAVNALLFAMIELFEKNKWAATIFGIGTAVVTITGLMLVFRAAIVRANSALLAYRVAATTAGVATQGAAYSMRGLVRGLLGVEVGAKRASVALKFFSIAAKSAGIGLAIGAIGYFANKMQGLRGDTQDASISLDEYNQIAQDAKNVSAGTGEEVENLADKLGGKGGGGSPSVADGASKAAEKVRLLTDYASDLSSVMSRSYSLRFDSASSMDSVISKWIKLREQAEQYQQEINKLTADKSLLQYWLSVAELYDDQIRASQLRSEISDIDYKLAKAQAGASRELAGGTNTAIDNRSAMRDLVSGYQDYIKSLAASGASQEFLQAEIQRINREFIEQATALGYNSSELGVYSAAFTDMSKVVAGAPRDVTVEFNGDPALQALAEFAASAKQSAASAGSAARGAFNDGFGDGIGGGGGGGDFAMPDPIASMPSDDDWRRKGAEDSRNWVTAAWQQLGNFGRDTIKVIGDIFLAIVKPLGDVAGGLPFLSIFGTSFDRFASESKNRFGGIGYFGASAFGTEFQKGLKRDEYFVDGILYQYDAASGISSRYGAINAKEFGDAYSKTDQGTYLKDGIEYARDSLTGEFYALGQANSQSYNEALNGGVSPADIIKEKIMNGASLTNQEASIVAAANGLTYETQFSKSDPMGKIAQKIRDGKELTNQEAKILADFNMGQYNSEAGSKADPGGKIAEKINSSKESTNKAAGKSGGEAGASWWDRFVSFLKFDSILNMPGFSFKPGGGKSGSNNKPKGFASGGFTGRGHWLEPAGIVHMGEHVVPKKFVDQRTGLPKIEYMESLKNGRPAPKGSSGSAGYANGGYVGGGGAIELGEYTIERLGRQVNVGLRVDRQELAMATSNGDARLAQRGSN